MKWKIVVKNKKLKDFKNFILISGFPGVASVGKLAIDYLISELNAKEYAEFVSDEGAGFTLITEDNTLEFPKIQLYHKKINQHDFFFLTGDYQPMQNTSLYDLSKCINVFAEENNVKQVLTLGGIGLEQEPDKPDVYVIANDKKFLEYLKKFKFKLNAFNRVGTIMGVTGVLVKLAKCPAAVCLAESSIFPTHIGLNAAKSILKKLNKMFDFKVKFTNMNKELKVIKKFQDEAMSIFQNEASGKRKQDYIG